MTNSNLSSTPPSANKIKAIAIAFLIISFVGFLDSAYLTIQHYRGEPLACAIFTGCETVASSKYAMVGPVPLALLGLLYYLTIFILSVAYFDTKREKIIVLASYLTIAGFLASIFFVYLQLFVINAICLYCIISAASSTLLFAFGAHTMFMFRNLISKHLLRPNKI